MQKSYKNQTFIIPNYLLRYLQNIKTAIDKKGIAKDTRGYNILNSILNETNITGHNLKRIKSLLEDSNTEDITKTILGGIDLSKNKLYIFVNNTLERKRDQKVSADETKMATGLRVRKEKKLTESKKTYLFIKEI